MTGAARPLHNGPANDTSAMRRPIDQPSAIASRLLINVVFCCLIALGVTLAGKGAWDTNLAYSLPIGTLSWLFIDLGRIALTRGSAVPWPHGWRGWLLMLAGTTFGFVVGTAIGNLYSGGTFDVLALAQQHDFASTLVITVAASAAICFLFYSRGKARFLEATIAQAQRDAAEARLKLLEAQLEPHMLFNTLANLRVLVATDPPRAQAMLDHLIAYLRATLGASRGTLHPLADEFARVADYLALMAVRMGPRLAFTLDLPESLAQASVPPLLLQPLVENAIRHGLEPQVEGGRIDVQARLLEDARIQLTVRDTGAGLTGAGLTGAGLNGGAPGGSGFGLQQVRERLATLYGAAGTLELIAGSAGGTSATVTFPLNAQPHEHLTAQGFDCRG